MKRFLLGLLLIAALSAPGALKYVDSTATGSHDGSSWANAWTSLSTMAPSAGDTVYISGGPSGSSQTYTNTTAFPIVNGSDASHRTAYQVGQDSLHNGTVKIAIQYNQQFLPPTMYNAVISGFVSGDTARHMVVTSGARIGYLTGATAGHNIQLTYIDLGAMQMGLKIDSADGSEFDHLKFIKLWQVKTADEPNDAFIVGDTWNASAYGLVKLHDNFIYLPRYTGYGTGDDGFHGMNGSDIYNNTVVGFYTNYFNGHGMEGIVSSFTQDGLLWIPTAGSDYTNYPQHQDGMQIGWGGHDRIYNNTFINCGNSSVFLEATIGSVHDCLVYNNIFTYDNSTPSVSTRGVDCTASSDSNWEYNNVVVANNLIIDMLGGGFSIREGAANHNFVGCVIANNIMVNVSDTLSGTDGNVAVMGNTSLLSSAQVAGEFASYTPYAGLVNNFQLTSAASDFRGTGANLSSYLSQFGMTAIDRNGATRPATGAWDKGPYQYGSITQPAIAIDQASYDFGAVAYPNHATNIWIVQNVGVGTLTGAANATAPFRIVGTASYSLGSNETAMIAVAYDPATRKDTGTVSFTGGGGATATANGHLFYIQPDLSFPSTNGDITAPFVVSGQYIYQPIEGTDPSSCGTATFNINIPTAGNYVVTANVRAPDDSQNSLFFNIDGDGLTDAMCVSDIQPPTGMTFQTRVLSWRGVNTDTNNEFIPKTFSLLPGIHTLVIGGREANVWIGQVTVALYSPSVNTAPVLPAQTNVVMNEMMLLTVVNTATDTDVPTQTMTYALTGPTGASISSSGVITWTPTEAQGPGAYTFTTVVTDNGSPSMSATNSFTVTVNEVNTAPVLPTQADRVVPELTLMTVNNAATDSDIPANTLTYSFLSSGLGASINSATGLITWTPNEAQGPGTYTFTTRVVDNGTPPLSATNTFTVTVTEVNLAPVLPSQTNHTIADGYALTVVNTATDADVPANTLTYVLTAPSGAAINGSGVITWTPTATQYGANTFKTVVSDNGSPVKKATNTFTVTVVPVRYGPTLPSLTNFSMPELTSMTRTNTATDTDLPAAVLAYSIDGPAGASITSSGIISWTPTEAQGPGSYVLTTVVSDISVAPIQKATNSFTVTVTEVNSAPTLGSPPTRTIIATAQAGFPNPASDSDLPPNAITYSLSAAPSGATIDTAGLIRWTPGIGDVGTTNTFTTIATDNGTPPLSATNSFSVIVQNQPPTGLRILRVLK